MTGSNLRLLRASARFGSRREVEALLNEHEVDFGCRPRILRDEDDFVLRFSASEEVINELKKKYRVEVLNEILPIPAEMIGKGDRFQGGRLFPRERKR